MTTFGLLHGVHGKKPYAVGHVPQVLVAGLGNCLDGWIGRYVSHDWRLLFREIDQWDPSGTELAGHGDPTRNVSTVVRL